MKTVNTQSAAPRVAPIAESVEVFLQQPQKDAAGNPVKEGNTPLYTGLTSAQVDFMNNTVGDVEDKTNVLSTAGDATEVIAFKVTPIPGQKVNAVQYTIGADDGNGGVNWGFTGSLTPNPSPWVANSEYKITASSIQTLAKNGSKVRIIVDTEPVEYVIAFSGDTAVTNAKVNVLKPDGTGYGEESGNNITHKTVGYGETYSFVITTDKDSNAGGTDPRAYTVTAAATGKTAITLTGKPFTAVGSDPAGVRYDVNVADLTGLSATGDSTTGEANGIAITLNSATVPVITLTNGTGWKRDDTNTDLAAAASFSLTDEANEDEFYVVNTDPTSVKTFTIGNKENKLAFKVDLNTAGKTAKKKIEIDAWYTLNSDTNTKHNLTVYPGKTSAGVDYNYVDLSGITEAAALFVDIATVFDSEQADIKTVDIQGTEGAVVKSYTGTDASTSWGSAGAKVVTNTVQTTNGNPVSGSDDRGVYEFVVGTKSPEYQITGVTASFTKKYSGAGNETAQVTDMLIGEDGAKCSATDSLYNYLVAAKLFTIPFSGNDAAEGGKGHWTTERIVIKVTAALKKADLETIVRFTSEGNYGTGKEKIGAYTVSVAESEGVELISEGVYRILPEAKYLDFTIPDMESVPKIELNGAENLNSGKTPYRLGETNQFRIPVNALDFDPGCDDEKNTEAHETVEVTRQSASITFSSSAGALNVKIADTEKKGTVENTYLGTAATGTVTAVASNPGSFDYETNSGSSGTNTITVNRDAPVTITIKKASSDNNPLTDITGVTYTVDGVKGSNVRQEKDAFIIETKASGKTTGDIAVTVVGASELDARVFYQSTGGTGGARQYPDVDGVHTVGAGEKITVQLWAGTTAAQQDVYKATVFDGGSLAATKARIKTKDVEITVDESELNKDLELVIVPLGYGRKPITLKLRFNGAMGGVDVQGGNFQDGVLSMPIGTRQILTVAPTGTGVSRKNLRVAIFDGKAAAPARLQAGDKASGGGGVWTAAAKAGLSLNTEYNTNTGFLTLTAHKAGDMKEKGNKSVRVVFYDESDKDLKVLPGSFVVDIKDATVLAAEKPVLTPIASTARTLRVGIQADGVETNLAQGLGDVYYKVEVDAAAGVYKEKTFEGVTFTAGEISAWAATQVKKLNKYYKKKDVDAAGGLTLEVLGSEIVSGNGTKKAAFPGMALKDFNIKVSVVQTNAGIDPNLNDSNVFASNTKGAGTLKMSTKEPNNYVSSDTKWKVEKLQTTISTGHTDKVAVARANFDGADEGVKITFVNTKTGAELGQAAPDGQEWGWRGLFAGYDYQTREIYVRSTPQTGNIDGDNGTDDQGDKTYESLERWNGNIYEYDFKDLGIKISTYAEETGYGANDVVALKVQSGVGRIWANVQSQVQWTGDKSDFKVSTRLNGEGENNYRAAWAPKNKNLTYDVIPGGTTLANYMAKNYDASLVNGFSVNNKTGVITVTNAYRMSQSTAGNTFRVAVSSEENPDVITLTGDFTVTKESQPLGALIVVKKGEVGGWSRSTRVSGDLPVSAETGEYKAVVLKAGVEDDIIDATGAGGAAEDIVNPRSVTITARGGVEMDADESGEFKIGKLGKVTFTAVDKNNAKEKRSEAVTFVQKDANLFLEIFRLDGVSRTKTGETWAGDKTQTVSFSGQNASWFGVDLVERRADGSTVKVPAGLTDVKLSLKGIASATLTPTDTFQYVLVTSAEKGSVTFQSKLLGKTEYLFQNNTYAVGSAKLEAVGSVPKFVPDSRSSLVYRAVPKNTAESLRGMYAVISVDASKTKTNPRDIRRAIGNLDQIIPIEDGSEFRFVFNPWYVGTYSYTVSIGALEGGVFSQKYANIKLALKVNKAGSVKLTAEKNYTINPYASTEAAIKATPGSFFVNDSDSAGYDRANGDSLAERTRLEGLNFAKNAIVNGSENDFRKYFEVKARVEEEQSSGDPAKNIFTPYVDSVSLKPGISASDLSALMNDPARKADLTGYICITNGAGQTDIPITITLKDDRKNIKATATPVVAGDKAVAFVTVLSGKEKIEAAGCTVGETSSWSAGITEDGRIRLEAKSAVKAGSFTVNLSVEPKNTPAFCRDAKAGTAYRLNVPVKITAVKASTSKKVSFSADSKTWAVSSTDFSVPAENQTGAWAKELKYSFKQNLSVAKGTAITVEADAKTKGFLTFESQAYDPDVQELTVKASIDRASLEASLNKKMNWGKKLTVDVTFSYGDAGLAKDKEKLTVILPSAPKSGATRETFAAGESVIRRRVNELYQANKAKRDLYEYRNGKDSYTDKMIADADEIIRAEIEKELRGLAGSEALGIAVSKQAAVGRNLANVFSASVKNGGTELYSCTFRANTESVTESDLLSKIVAKIIALGAGTGTGANPVQGWTFAGESGDLLEDLEEIRDKELTKDISNEEYAALIRKLVEKAGQPMGDVEIQVETRTDAGYTRKAPTTRDKGRYNVFVTLTNPNQSVNEYVRPADFDFITENGKNRKKNNSTGNSYRNMVAISYEFNRLEGAEEALSRLSGDLDDAALDIVKEAWNSVAKIGMEFDSAEMQKALEEGIVKKANNLIAAGVKDTAIGNTALKATGLRKDSLYYEIKNGSLEKFGYVLLLSDSTAGAATPAPIEKKYDAFDAGVSGEFWGAAEIKENLKDILGVNVLNYSARLDSEGELKDLGYTNIDFAGSQAAAFGMIEAKIKASIKNKAFDASSIHVVEPTGTNTAYFLAPTGSENGYVHAQVEIGTGTAKETANVEGITILRDSKDFTLSGTMSWTTASTDEQKFAALKVSAAVTKEAVWKIFRDAQIEYATAVREAAGPTFAGGTTAVVTAKKPNGGTDFVIKNKLKALVNNALKGTGFTFDDSTAFVSGTDFNVPTSDGATANAIAARKKITITDGATTPATFTVDINGGQAMAIDPIPEYQAFGTLGSLAAGDAAKIFRDDMLDGLGLVSAGKNALEIEYIAGAETTNTDIVKEQLRLAVRNGLFGRTAKKVTNPLFDVNVTLSANQRFNSKVATETALAGKVNNLEVLFVDLSNASSVKDTKNIDVHVLAKKDGTEYAEAVQFVDASGTVLSKSAANPEIVDVDGNTFSVPVLAQGNTTAVDDATEEWNIKGDATAFEWSVTALSTAAGNAVEADQKAALEGIEIRDGVLDIPAKAHGDTKNERLLKITATLKTRGYSGIPVSNDHFIKLKFKPSVEIEIMDGPSVLELNAAGTKTGVYTAKIGGAHVNPAQVASLTWEAWKEDKSAKLTTGVAFAAAGVNSPDDQKEMTWTTHTITENSGEFENIYIKAYFNASHKVDSAAEFENQTDAVAWYPVTLKPYAKLGDAKVTMDTSAKEGYTTESLGEGKPTRITVSGKDIRIPLGISGSLQSRGWEFGVSGALGGDSSKVSIETVGSKSWLVIKDALTSVDAPARTNDVANLSVTADSVPTASQSGETSFAAERLNLQIVAQRSVSRLGIYQTADASDTTRIDDGTGNMEVVNTETAGTDKTFYIHAGLEGAHLTNSERQGEGVDITYTILGMSSKMVASLSGDTDTDNKVTATTDGSVAVEIDNTTTVKTGSITLGATYKGETGEPVRAVRVVRVVSEGVVEDNNTLNITVDEEWSADPSTLTYKIGDGTETASWSIKKVSGPSNLNWGTEDEKYIKHNAASGTSFTVDIKTCPYGYSEGGGTYTAIGKNDVGTSTVALPGLPAGVYKVYIVGTWTDSNNVVRESKKLLTIDLRQIATGVKFYTNLPDGDWHEDSNGAVDVTVLASDGSVSVKEFNVRGELDGERLSPENKNKVKFEFTAPTGDNAGEIKVNGETADITTAVEKDTTKVEILDGAKEDDTFMIKFMKNSGDDVEEGSSYNDLETTITPKKST